MSPNGQGQCLDKWCGHTGSYPSSGWGKVREMEIITLRDRGHVTSITHHKSPGVKTSEHENISFMDCDTSFLFCQHHKRQILSFMSSEESERYWASLSFPFIKHGLRTNAGGLGLLSRGGCIISAVVTSLDQLSISPLRIWRDSEVIASGAIS